MLIIWWKGWGWLGLALPLLGGILFTYFGFKVANSSYDEYLWTYFSTGVALGGLAVVVLALWLNSRSRPAGFDPTTGLPVTVPRGDSLYWISMRYWGYAGVAIGAVFAAYTLISA
jgi:hypothetical protein